MLEMSADQMKAMNRSVLQEFEGRMVTHLCSMQAASTTESNGRLTVLVRTGIEVAMQYGIHHQLDVQRFLELSIAHGADFHQRPWASAILRDAAATAVNRIDRLEAHAVLSLRPQ